MKLEVKFSKSLLKRNNAVGITHGTSTAAKAEAVKAFMQAKKSYKSDLFTNMNTLLKGGIDKETFEKLQQQTISKHFTASYMLGKKFNQSTETTLSDSERRFIVFQTTEEMKFMSGFATDLVNVTGKMNYQRRMNMYAAGLDPMFKLGDISYLPDDIQIEWLLGRTDKHCLDCLMFSKGNPYTKRTLPGIPKSCNSACLSNCKCSLNYYTDTVNTKYTNFIIDNYTESRENIPNENDYEYIKTQTDDYYNNRLKYEMTKVDNYLEKSAQSKANLSNFITAGNLAVAVPVYIASQMMELKLFKKDDNFEYVEDSRTLKIGQLVSAFVAGTQMYGKITSISGNMLTISTLFDKNVEVNLNIHVVFREIL